MIHQFKTMIFGNLPLALFDQFIVKLDHLIAVHADHVVMMVALGELEYAVAGLEIVACHEPGGFELGQNSVDGGQSDILAGIQKRTVDVFSAHVLCAALCGVEQLQDLDPRQRDFETCVAQLLIFRRHCGASLVR